MAESRTPSTARHSEPKDSRQYIPQEVEALISSEGDIGPSTSDLVEVISYPNHFQDETLVANGVEDDAAKAIRKPWYRRSSPYWILCMMPLASIAMTTTIAPRVQIYTRLVCQAHRPEYMIEDDGSLEPLLFGAAFHAGSGARTDWHPLSVINTVESAVNESTYRIPSPSQACLKDPAISAYVAELIAIMSSTLGVLSCLTVGWWGQLCDRWGRVKVLRVVIAGMLFADVNFIVTTLFATHLPGGYWFLLLSSVVDGLLGGMGAGSAAMHAYISDCTSSGSRSRIFSLSMGLLFSGMAVGPILGGQIIHYTDDLLSVFYIATGFHLLSFVAWCFIIPESLEDSVKQENIRKHDESVREQEQERIAQAAGGDACRRFRWSSLKNYVPFLKPLAIVLPKLRDPNDPKKGRDWNLTLLVMTQGTAQFLMGSYQYKFQYAGLTFGWDAEQLSYWLSLAGIARAVHLLIVLPVIIKLFKPKAIRLSGPENALGSRASSAHHRSISSRRRPPGRASTFDLALARGSLIVDILSYSFVVMSVTSVQWTAATILGSFGGGLSPAIHSLALQVSGGASDAGRLFGGLSVVQALCSQVIGPPLFGLTYIATVSVFPKGIFVVALVVMLIAFLLLCMVRLPDENVDPAAVDREATLVDSIDNDEQGVPAAAANGKPAGTPVA